jgi:hypothetical protein
MTIRGSFLVLVVLSAAVFAFQGQAAARAQIVSDPTVAFEDPGTIPIATAHAARYCPDNGHFVAHDPGPIFTAVAGRYHTIAAPDVSTADDYESGTRTTTISDGASLGTLVIQGTSYSWGTVRNARLALYVPKDCFQDALNPYHAYLAVNNGANWYFIALNGDRKLSLYKVKTDWFFGVLTRF